MARNSSKILQLNSDSNSEILVSVIINNYNYGRFLKDAIDSVINQTYTPCEIIVVDDGSTDDSHQIMEKYENKIISLIKQNGGQASAFNSGFARSQGEIICFLDADDVFESDKVEEIVSSLKQYPEADWCFHPVKLVDSSGKAINPEITYGASNIYDIRPYITQGKLRDKLPFQGPVTSGMCFKRTLLNELLPMPEEIKITSDDYLKYAAFGLSKGVCLLKELALQRIHNNNAYTLRTDKNILIGQVGLLTAYWLKRKYPIMSPFANKIFAFGLATLLGKVKELRLQNIIHEYVGSLNPIETLSFCMRVLYFRIKMVAQYGKFNCRLRKKEKSY
jgi:glycosyltransferase involved in cell wall biosynthesis